VALNGFDTLALMKLDVLDELAEIPVCTGYRHRGQVLSDFPSDVDLLAECEPVYETLPGWRTPTLGMREFKDLPAAAQRYVERLSELVDCEIGIVSTGPERNHTILRGRSASARWFE
jgi:adenylosuccinate synthase